MSEHEQDREAVGPRLDRGVVPAVPTRADVDALMRACQRGFTVRQWNQAHSVLAECYGTLGALMLAVERMASWLEGECYCPCCAETRQCLNGCTFATDCPDQAERMEGARGAIYGHNVGGEARLAAHQPSQTTTATPQGVASTDQLGRASEARN